MKLSSRLGFLAAMGVTLVLGACSSTPVGKGVQASPTVVAKQSPATPQTPTQASPTAPMPKATVTAAPIAPHLDAASALYQKRSIYFDFDEFTVKKDFAPLLELHGKYLASHPKLAIKIQGNTDDVGGTEYNLALGQKRAEAVSKALKVYGVKDSQMEAVSFGEEKPKAPGHDDASRTQNRRVDLAYPEK